MKRIDLLQAFPFQYLSSLDNIVLERLVNLV